MPKSIQQAVNELLRQRSDLLVALRMDLVNGNALARQLKPKVERIVKSKVKLNTITVAIKRYQKKFIKTGKVGMDLSLDVAEIITKAPLMFYVYENNPTSAMYFSNLMSVSGVFEKISGMFMDPSRIYIAFSADILDKIQKSKAVLIAAIEDAAWFGLRLNQEVEPIILQKLSDFIVNSGIEVYGSFVGTHDISYIINKKHLPKFIESFS